MNLQEIRTVILSQFTKLAQLIYSKFKNSIKILFDRRNYLLKLSASGSCSDMRANIKNPPDTIAQLINIESVKKALEKKFINKDALPEIGIKQQKINKLEEDNKIFMNDIQQIKETMDANEFQYKNAKENLTEKITSLENRILLYKESEIKKDLIEVELKKKIECLLNENNNVKKENVDLNQFKKVGEDAVIKNMEDNKKIKLLEEKINELTYSNTGLKAKLTEIENKQMKTKKDEQELKEKISSLECQNLLYKENAMKKYFTNRPSEGESTKQIDNLLDKIDNLTRKKEITQLKKAGENADFKNLEIEKKINSLKKKKNDYKSYMQQMEDEIKKLECSNTELQYRLREAEAIAHQRIGFMSSIQLDRTTKGAKTTKNEGSIKFKIIGLQNLSDEEVESARELADRAKFSDESREEMCKFIKRKLRKRIGGKWNVFIGENVSYHYKSKSKYLFFKLGNDTFLLFSRNELVKNSFR